MVTVLNKFLVVKSTQIPSRLVEWIESIDGEISWIESLKDSSVSRPYFQMIKGCLTYIDHSLNWKVSFDFVDYLKTFKRQAQFLKRGPLSLAIGIKNHQSYQVVDATCGSGKDSFLMLSWGAYVEAFERNPYVYLLLLDALIRFEKSPFFQEYGHKFKLTFGTFEDVETLKADALYYDPMYPVTESKKKTALPRKEIQLFRKLVGADSDIGTVFEKAKLKKIPKIIVKRALYSKEFCATPSTSFKPTTIIAGS